MPKPALKFSSPFMVSPLINFIAAGLPSQCITTTTSQDTVSQEIKGCVACIQGQVVNEFGAGFIDRLANDVIVHPRQCGRSQHEARRDRRW